MRGRLPLNGVHGTLLQHTVAVFRLRQLYCSLSIVFRWQQWRLLQNLTYFPGVSKLTATKTESFLSQLNRAEIKAIGHINENTNRYRTHFFINMVFDKFCLQ
jgi:hypothetical protein